MNDLVSVIMPSYNCGRFVEETIRSVQAQTYQNWEIIFMDDCSTDDTIRIVSSLKESDNRIHLYQNAFNQGAAISRNKALREAKGRWIAFLDSDDLWEPTKLEKQIRFMEENDYHFSCTDRDEIDEGSKPLGTYTTGPKHITKAGMFRYCWVGCLTVMYDANVVGLIQVADLKKNNDYAMWLKVIKKTDCYLLNECLSHYRVRKGSISHARWYKLIKSHYDLFRIGEEMNPFSALFYTLQNMFFGVVKKVIYKKY